MNKKKIFLTGASGTVGYEVLKQLLKQKDEYEVFVFDIKNQKSIKLFKKYKSDFELFYGDITLESEVIQAVKKAGEIDTVIHLAALIPPAADDHPDLAYKINVKGTEYLIAALEKYSRDVFFLYSSSISVYGDRLKTPYIKVGDALQPSLGDEYAKTKIEAEYLIQNSSLNWSIFRLTAIMGNHQISKLMFHMPLNTCLEIASPGDAARAFCHAIEQKEKLSGQIFNLGGGTSCRISYKEFLSRSFDVAGLGELDFPEDAFANQNFHCGFYEDGDQLEHLLHFRKDTLQTHFQKQGQKISNWEKRGAQLFNKIIKKQLLKKSEPLKALSDDNSGMKERFFKSKNNAT